MSSYFVKRPSDSKRDSLESLPVYLKNLKSEDFNKILGFYSQSDAHGYMSNFYKSPFKVSIKNFNVTDLEKMADSDGNLCFTNSEQAFMMFKGLTFLDRNYSKNIEVLTQLMSETEPNAIKKLGRQLVCTSKDGAPFDEETWKKERCSCMYDSLWYKFTQNTDIYKQFLDTDDKHLVEATQNDKNWGNGLHMSSDDLQKPTKWTGTNLLGECLMVLRDRFKEDLSLPVET
jgi:ribA/ribD-fused uncharacterized protein